MFSNSVSFVMKLSCAKNKTANPFAIFLGRVEITQAKLEKYIVYSFLQQLYSSIRLLNYIHSLSLLHY